MVGNENYGWDGSGYEVDEESAGSEHWNRKAIMGMVWKPTEGKLSQIYEGDPNEDSY